MSANRDILVELATEPLAGQEEERSVAQDLRARIEESGVSDAEVAEAVALLGKADRRGIVRHWKKVLYVVVGILVVVGVVQNVRMRAALPMLTDMGGFHSDEPAPKVQRPARFSESELLLLYGREDAVGEAEKWKPLWESQPQNPVYFAEYVAGVLQDTNTVPDEILQKAAEIDPDNAWYMALKAGVLLKESVERGKRADRERKDLKAFEYTVKNEETFLQGLALLHDVARKPKYDSYQEEMMRERIRVMGKPRDWFGFIAQLAYVAGDSTPGLTGMMSFSRALAVEAGRCAEKGDREGCLRAFAAWERIASHLVEDGHAMVDLLVAKVVMTEPAANFRDAALKLGMEKEAKRFDDLARWQYEDWASRNGPNRNRKLSQDDILMEKKASMMGSLALPMLGHQVRKPPVLTADDMQPSRLMEYAFLLRVLVGCGSVVLLFAAGAAALRLACSSKQNLVLSRRFDGMLPARDWLGILLIGGVLPVLWYGLICYGTPLSPRDWSPRLGMMYVFPLQFASAVILLLALTSALVSWKCDRRLALLCGRSRLPKWRWVMVALAFLAVPLSGALLPLLGFMPYISSRFLILLWAAAAFAAVPLLWMLFRIIKPVFGKKDTTPRTATLIRMALPGVCAGIVTLSAAVPFLQWEERHWLAKDRLMVITPEAPAMTRYEWEVTQVLRGELQELMGK